MTTNVSTLGTTRIPVRYARTLLLRGLAIWVLARVFAQALYLAIAASADREIAAAFTNGSSLILAIWTLVLSAAIVRIDFYRRHEVVLLHNLGVIIWQAMLMGTLPAVVMETVMAIVR